MGKQIVCEGCDIVIEPQEAVVIIEMGMVTESNSIIVNEIEYVCEDCFRRFKY